MKYVFTTFFLAFTINSFAQSSDSTSNDTIFFKMGEVTGTDLCTGTLFDSGGPDGNYQSNEENIFTICPSDSSTCIALEVEAYDIETLFDRLYIFDGSDINGELLATADGQGFGTLAFGQSGCVTIKFISDPSQNNSGFRLKWECQTESCPSIEPTTCQAPFLIPSFPFQATDLTTCFAGNNLETTICGDDNFLMGKDYIFAYESNGDECIRIAIDGVLGETGISIFRGCPTLGETVCINQKQASIEEASIILPNVSLSEKGMYYFVVAHERNCTPFNIEILPSSTCPKVFPSAAECSKGLVLNGCNPDLPAALTVEPSSGDPNFFRFGINNGCWEDVFETNYTWFTFEAQGDGNFAFLLSNNDPNDVVDIDFNIWGPFDNLETACGGADNLQPIRSSWADDLENSITGLAAVNPILGTPVTSTCEGAFGEGFVKPLAVKKGEVYVVLINDFDGVIYSGAVAIDFSGSDANVLAHIPNAVTVTQDTVICMGDSIALNATGASVYKWDNATSLSCRNCPNPIAFPVETTTYTVTASTVCNTEVNQITVEVVPFIEIPIIANTPLLCETATLELTAELPATAEAIAWTPNETIDCANCPVTTVTPFQTTTYTLNATLDNCSLVGKTTVEVINFGATFLENFGESEILLGQSVDSIVLQTNLKNIIAIEWLENGTLIENATGFTLNYIPLNTEPVSSETRTVIIEALIETAEGCTYTDELTILVKPPSIPNTFTPNNDNKNDYFNILLPESAAEMLVFKVYNRWGKLIYDKDEVSKGWNGGLRNDLSTPMPAGVYVYFIQYEKEGKVETLRGDVTLLR